MAKIQYGEGFVEKHLRDSIGSDDELIAIHQHRNGGLSFENPRFVKKNTVFVYPGGAEFFKICLENVTWENSPDEAGQLYALIPRNVRSATSKAGKNGNTIVYFVDRYDYVYVFASPEGRENHWRYVVSHVSTNLK